MNHSTFTVCFTKTFSCDSLYLFYIVVIRLFFFSIWMRHVVK